MYAQFREDLAFWDVMLSSWDEESHKVGTIDTSWWWWYIPLIVTIWKTGVLNTKAVETSNITILTPMKSEHNTLHWPQNNNERSVWNRTNKKKSVVGWMVNTPIMPWWTSLQQRNTACEICQETFYTWSLATGYFGHINAVQHNIFT